MPHFYYALNGRLMAVPRGAALPSDCRGELFRYDTENVPRKRQLTLVKTTKRREAKLENTTKLSNDTKKDDNIIAKAKFI